MTLIHFLACLKFILANYPLYEYEQELLKMLHNFLENEYTIKNYKGRREFYLCGYNSDPPIIVNYLAGKLGVKRINNIPHITLFYEFRDHKAMEKWLYNLFDSEVLGNNENKTYKELYLESLEIVSNV